DADNPAYLMLVSQLKSTDAQYQALETQLVAAQQQQEQYQKEIAQTPAVEQELNALSRDYDGAKLRFKELKEKQLSAQMSQQMEQGRQDQHMVVLNAPDLPTQTTPPRWAFLAGGIFLALFAGVGGAYAAESMSQTIHGTRHLIDLTGIVPLVTVPHI